MFGLQPQVQSLQLEQLAMLVTRTPPLGYQYFKGRPLARLRHKVHDPLLELVHQVNQVLNFLRDLINLYLLHLLLHKEKRYHQLQEQYLLPQLVQMQLDHRLN